ncbi:5359_t:CDS:2 [Acaulospora colombiana]|uniref:5359_t:CDS:1 n=1 Tax=Acaulospora colombiana TaxID=27376 RepID=A0ACA9K4R6_9GLOM|nr:5359_t:CDS:2 [Acaulospora colombiana]
MYDQATSPIVIEDTNNTPDDSGNQANKNSGRTTFPDESNNVYVMQDSAKGSKPSNYEDQSNENNENDTKMILLCKLQGLLQDLSTPIKGGTDEDGDDEGSGGSLSQSLA